jgi:hypothetical protein
MRVKLGRMLAYHLIVRCRNFELIFFALLPLADFSFVARTSVNDPAPPM